MGTFKIASIGIKNLILVQSSNYFVMRNVESTLRKKGGKVVNFVDRIKSWFNYRTIGKEITKEEAIDMIKLNKDIILLDVRSPLEYNEGHLDNAILIPVYELTKNVNNIIPNKEEIIIVYCQYGVRSKKATKILEKLGYNNIYQIKGGIQ